MITVPLSPTATNCVPDQATLDSILPDTPEVCWVQFLVAVSLVESEMFPAAAVIVVVPLLLEVAIPFEPAILLIVATDVSEELQVTNGVIS